VCSLLETWFYFCACYILDKSDPIDAHHSVFQRLDHSRNEQKTTSISIQKVTSNTSTKQNFEEQLHQVALSAVMECLQDKQKLSSKKPNSTSLTSRSQPELQQTEKTSGTGKVNTFDRLTQINTMREPIKLPSQSETSGSKRTISSPGNLPRKIKLRMDSVDDPATSKQGVMSRLGKQSAFRKPSVKQSVFNRLNNWISFYTPL